LRSLVVTAIVTFALPLVLLGSLFLLLTSLKVLLPELAMVQEIIRQLQTFLAILGNGDPWQGALLVGTVSCLVGMLFDTYAFYRYQGVNHRWFN
jgi:cellobiose-specific phosphotransferase system component IIC